MFNMSMFSSYVDQMHVIMLKYTAYKCVVYVIKYFMDEMCVLGFYIYMYVLLYICNRSTWTSLNICLVCCESLFCFHPKCVNGMLVNFVFFRNSSCCYVFVL